MTHPRTVDHVETSTQPKNLEHPRVVDARQRLHAVATRHRLDQETIDTALRWAACQHGDQLRKSGEPYIVHPIEVAVMVADLGGGVDTVQAALLHDTVEDTAATSKDIQKRFGSDVARIVEGCTKVAAVHPSAGAAGRQADNLRKLFVALADDPRVIVVKLCDRLHNLRTIAALGPEKARRIGEETLAIHAPLAHRLGMGAVKAELEDRAFAAADPETHRRIVTRIASEQDLHATLEDARARLEAHLGETGLTGSVSGRVKHAWSLHRKAQRMNIDHLDIPDLLGLRVICDDVDACYRIVDAVHALWEPDLDRYKDYISAPKFNSYQSLHTTVVGPGDRTMEVQVRTRQMHETAEHGAASHHRYKNPGEEPQWLSRLLSWEDEDDDDYLRDVAQELDARREILVLTPQDAVITLPAGASVIDFAYAIHSDIGNRCTGARVDGKMVSLETRLVSGQRVEVITGNREGPSVHWLEHAVTGRARSRIRRHSKNPHPVGAEITTEPNPPPTRRTARPHTHRPETRHHTQVAVADLAGTPTKLAGCCEPQPGQPVAAVATTQRLSVHHQDCPVLGGVRNREPGRIVNAYWVEDAHVVELFDIRIPDRPGIFADIAGVIRAGDATILSTREEPERVLVEVSVHRRARQRLRAALRLIDGVRSVH